ncbi:MAG TPA: hypothetical protein VJ140_14665, partial [Actinomycetota bacterium]|nr:hypothetical protein [Actinomycetota bacterium]
MTAGVGNYVTQNPPYLGNFVIAHTVHPDGFEPSSVVTRGNCKAWMNTKKIHGHWYAQGLVRSWNRTHCVMMLQRKHGGAWERITWYHWVKDNAQDHTGYYWDDRGYKARVCLQNLDWNDSSWHCGKG